MKRAALVLATSVALFICAVGSANATTRKYVSMPSNGSVVSGGGAVKSGDSLVVTGQPLEGEYIPSSYGGGSKGTKLPVKPNYDYSIPRTLKGMTSTLRGGVVGIGLTLGLEWMLDQVGGFIDENGQPVKPGEETQPTKSLYWCYQTNPANCLDSTSNTNYKKYATALDALLALGAAYTTYEYDSHTLWFNSDIQAQGKLNLRNKTTGAILTLNSIPINRHGQCELGYTYSSQRTTCVKASGTVPLTDADYEIMEAAAAAKDSEWLKDRLRDHCEGSLSPESCYESLRDSVSLSGPSSVIENGPTSTTVGPTGTTTTTAKTDISITYGDNYYDYRKTSTVVKTNPDGTTETTTETEPEETTEDEAEKMPEVTDLYKPYIDKLKTIETDVAVAPGVTAPIGYSSWYAFGGGCSEISAELPVIGSWQTNYCPLINDWVRPVLAFIFVMFTWHYCRSLWSEAVTKARPM